ncbi:proline and serine-rich protein 3 isoform X4 [Xyrichtys novacula]|uniref:Proline and serine-rich protein 3 isoform X4 n=1 Tax=Xyrichtys novacula TaxID=13765 RepID=A0AAV1FMI4_XYRNO|nr:proline and serine-rich protein 3 isoform X4 [Xyrichtys novacula]
MKSSGPVFKSKQNQPASKVRKTHNHPSSNKPMSHKKKTTLSPVRIIQQSSPQLHTRRSPVERMLFEEPDHSFADSRSPLASASASMVTPGQSVRVGQHTVSSEPGIQQDSVMAKYIERFRHGRPQSREERHQTASVFGDNPEPFWWTSTSASPPSSTPTNTAVKDFLHPLDRDAPYSSLQSRRDRSLSPCRGSQSILSDTSSCDFDDSQLLQLQEKANRLLLRDEYATNEESIHVSSEGLGCSDFSSPLSTDEPVQRPLVPLANANASLDSIRALTSQKPSEIPSLMPPTRPEEDILFQWRLRRKIEQARESPWQQSGCHGAASNWQSPSLSQTPNRGQVYKGSTQNPDIAGKSVHPHTASLRPETKETPGSSTPSLGPAAFPPFAVSSSSVSQPQTVANVPAHMHYLCDILPCPSQTSNASTEQDILQGMDETSGVHKKAKVPENSLKTATNKPDCEHLPAQPHAPSGAMEGERPCHHRDTERTKREKCQTKGSEKIQKEPPVSCRKQKKSTSSSHHRVSRKVLPLAEEQQQQKGPKEFRSGRRIDHAPPSHIKSALGQAVSEVLFPTAESSPAQETPVSSVSPPHTLSALSQSSVHQCNDQNSLEVISQLLQEAEDSDEKEFEDDTLLLVLRKQRKRVKEHIREVDYLINDILDKQQSTLLLAK